MMDYEQEEQFEEQAEEPQVKDMEMDDDDASYLDLRDNNKRQAYAILKRRSFGHTNAFDLDLLEKTGKDVDFARVWHAIRWESFVPVEENGSRLLIIQFFALFGRWMVVFVSRFSGMNTILLGRIWVTTSALAHACRFLLNKPVAVLIAMIFGV